MTKIIQTMERKKSEWLEGKPRVGFKDENG